MNSNDKIPSIKEVVEQLRAEGRLDEEKWRRCFFRIYIKRILISLLCSSIFMYLVYYLRGENLIHYLLQGVSIIVAATFLYRSIPNNKEIKGRFFLYNQGQKIEAEVIDNISISLGAPNYPFRKISYKALLDNQTIQDEFTASKNAKNINNKKVTMKELKSGDVIQVLYHPSLKSTEIMIDDLFWINVTKT